MQTLSGRKRNRPVRYESFENPPATKEIDGGPEPPDSGRNRRSTSTVHEISGNKVTEDCTTESTIDESPPLRLLLNAQRGDAEGLGQLLDCYRSYLSILARAQIGRQLQARVDSSDVVQETMLEAVRDFEDFRGCSEKEFLSWLRQILINNLHRSVEHHIHTRKRDVRCEVPVDQISASVDRAAAGLNAFAMKTATTPSVVMAQRESGSFISEQLARLPEHYRQVIVLRNIAGLPFEKVGEEMGRSPGAVRMLWVRAIDRFRTLLEETQGLSAVVSIDGVRDV